MKILAFDTTAKAVCAAICEDEKLLSSYFAELPGVHTTETLLPAIEIMLKNANLTIDDMELIAVSAGPGSFTGVRIGVCAINAMAAAFDKPVVQVSSLEGLLYGLGNACALIDCRNGNGYAMVVSHEVTLPPSAVVISELLAELPEDILIVGDGAELHHDAIAAALPSARYAEDNQVDAAKCGLAAWAKLMADDTLKEAMPLYLRPSQAERMAKEKK